MKIPNGWRKVKFGDVVHKVNDKVPNRNDWTFDRYIGGQHFSEGEIRVTNSNLIKGNEEVIGSAFHMRFKPGHVLYVTRNPRLRKGGVVDFEGVCSNVSFVLQADETQLLQSLLPFVIQTEDFVMHTCNNAHGSTNPFLNWKDIAKYEFLLPPLEEQKKISEVLWSIDDNINRIKLLFNNSISFKDKFELDILMEGNDIRVIKEYLSGKIKSKNKILKLETATEFIRDGTHITPTYVSKGIPFLRVTDIQTDSINWRNVKYIPMEEHKLLTKVIKPKKGDVLLSKNGTVGIPKIIDWEREFSFFVSLCLIRPKITILSTDYLFNFLNSKLAKLQILFRSKTGTVTNLHLEEIRDFDLPLPPLDIQKKISKKFEIINKKIDNIKKQKNGSISLRNKLSNELLSGKLRLE